MHLWVLTVLMIFLLIVGIRSKRPNIVFIVADDMGWDDVSFHGSDQILTPNIDLLAYTGIALERYYSHCICTPSRAAMLTGKFAHVTGMHGYPLTNTEDRSLPLSEKLLPEYFKDLGYDTHLIGKWHLGLSRTEHLPTSRGFDSHFGHRGGYIDYYEYVLIEDLGNEELYGFDLFKNGTAAWDVEGYITDVYTEQARSVIKDHDVSKPLFMMVAHNAPHAANVGSDLQAPPEDVRAMRHVESIQRRIYAGMVRKLDESVGNIVESLSNKGILGDTIIVFVSDNGGMTSGAVQNFASNRPLRGLKFTPFEGGTRVNGLIWSKNLTESNHLWKGYIHVSDWLPTLLKAVGSEPPENIDGIDLWDSIKFNNDSKRDLFYEIDEYEGFASITKGDYKLVTGHVITDYGNHQGNKLTGIIGKPPSYKETLENSTLHTVLSKIGISLKHEDIIHLRKDIKVSCSENIDRELCYPNANTLCLYNIKEDPCEIDDISASNPDVVDKLYSLLEIEKNRGLPRKLLYRDPRSKPSLHNYTWTTWMD